MRGAEISAALCRQAIHENGFSAINADNRENQIRLGASNKIERQPTKSYRAKLFSFCRLSEDAQSYITPYFFHDRGENR
jgi:hypothetical protein